MDLIDRLKELSARASQIIDKLETEEATKNALVMPFIVALGYNVFNPMEVSPEFTADVGVKKGEKCDYAIMHDASPIMLFECKPCRSNLSNSHASQLYRYFSTTEARFGFLTNGINYKVYSDLESPNKMDSLPFLEFSILEITDDIANQLKKFAKESFDLDSILSTASDLKYTGGIKSLFLEEWANPSDEMVRVLASRVYQGKLTQKVKEQFTVFVKKAFHGFVSDRINERLKSAMTASDASSEPFDPEDSVETSDSSRIVTTHDELEAYHMVKAIVREVVDAKRVFIRDTQSYCGILLDDNNRRPICRLHFNSSQKFISIPNDAKDMVRHDIEDVNELYAYADDLKNTALRYDSPGATEEPCNSIE